MNELEALCREMAARARDASQTLARANGEVKNAFLLDAAARVRTSAASIRTANEQDLSAAPSYGLTDAQIDRLRLTPDRIEAIARGLEAVAALPDPVGEVIEGGSRPNGLQILKVRVPLGVVFFIYESRPNVTADAAAICVKSGNAVILRGGKEAAHSSQAIVELLWQSLDAVGLPRDVVQCVATRDRAAVGHFLKLDDLIDITIPRGGYSLIERVAREAAMPVIKHFAGNCHIYVDQFADLEMATRIVINAKCQRPGVCNACESLLVHEDHVDTWLPTLAQELEARGVEIRGDERCREAVPSAKIATEADYRTEFLDWVISVKTVRDLSEAVHHINEYGSKHSDAIVTRNFEHAQRFTQDVDSAAVFVNASTRFHDGSEFGMGAEIGISTDKFHARGPCGLRELTSYKYVVLGEGHVRE